jgi:hypothetical protein
LHGHGHPNLLPNNLARQYSTFYTSAPIEAALNSGDPDFRGITSLLSKVPSYFREHPILQKPFLFVCGVESFSKHVLLF